MPARAVRKIIPIHPAEADAISKAFGDADTSSNSILDLLNKICGALDGEWEGNQKIKFMAEFGGTIHRIQDILLPSLEDRKNKYHAFIAEKVVEVVEYY
ncbi:MAG: hypothetical protein ABSC61_01650 [Anaerolineales bacterium]